MANTKEYKIVINGVSEAINAVESLSKKLESLEQRINTVNSKKVSSGGGSTSSARANTSALSEEAKLEKQIEQIDAKRKAYSKEIYQNYLAAKEVLSDTVKDQKQIAASERLQANNYSNTIKGMKQELADIKEVMQTVDLGDTAEFDRLTQRANELNEALKKIEATYGQFGRNVGNYKSAFDSLGGIVVTINGVEKTFDNLKQATKAIRDEMGKLEYNNQQNTQEYKNLEKELDKVTKAQLRLNSALNDAKSSSKAMDDMLDTMESFVALGQVGRGFSTFFGLDSTELEKQIAKLVALQNMLQGIEKLRKQMNTKEGIGKWLDIGSKSVDKFVAKLAGAEIRMGKIIGKSKEASVNLARLSSVIKIGGGILAGFVTSAVIETIGNLISKFKDWYTGGKAAAAVTDQLSTSFEVLVKKYERITRDNQGKWFRNTGNDVKYLDTNVKNLVNELSTLLTVLHDVEKVDFTKPRGSILGGIDLGYSGSTNGWGVPNNGKNQEKALNEAKERFLKLGQMIERYQEELDKSIIPNWITESYNFLTGGGINKLKREYATLGEELAQNLIGSYNEVINKAQSEISGTGKVSEATRMEIRKLNDELNYDMVSGSLMEHIDKFSERGQFYINQIALVRKEFQKLAEATGSKEFSPDYVAQLEIDGMKQSEAKIKKQNELNRKKELAEAGDNKTVRKLINKKYETELNEQLTSFRKSKASEYKQKKKEYTDAENDLAKLRLELMKDGWAKIKKQLELEKEERLKTIKDSGILVKQRSELIEKLYNEEDGKKYLEARKEWSKQVIETYENMYKTIEDIRKQNMQTEVSNAKENTERKRDQSIENSGFFYAKYDDTLRNMKDYYTEVAKIEQAAAKKLNAIRKEELDKQYEFDTQEENLRHKRMADAETTALVMEKLAKYEEEKGVPLVPESASEDWAKLESELQSNLNNMSGELVDAYNKGELEFKNFVELIEKEQDAHNSRMNALQKEYNSNVLQNDKDLTDSMRESENKRFTSLIAQARQKMDELGNVMSQQPIKDEEGWGVVNIKKTNENYKKVAEGYKNTTEYLIQLKAELKQKLDNKEITAEDFFARKSELDAAIKASEEASKDIIDKQKDVFGEFLRSIQQYIQAVGQGIQQIMSAVWDAQDVAFDKEQEQLDKENEALQKALDKNEEILEKHKNNVDSIENELQTARGSRREHLIDQLNAEVEAQRRAAAEDKKIKKQQEAQEKKQEALNKKRQEAEYKRNLASILVSGAMAAVNAYATKPFIPVGLAMGSLAIALTAAQYAIAKSAKPYAHGGQLDGGVAQGARHSEGGIKVLGGRAEIEGGEFITNRTSTEKNIDLLEYINSKKKRVDINDLIEFYQGDVPRRTIKNIRTKYADGGQLMPNNLDISEQLQNVVVNQDNRPIYVSVVDINNKQKDVRNVKVLAGLDE